MLCNPTAMQIFKNMLDTVSHLAPLADKIEILYSPPYKAFFTILHNEYRNQEDNSVLINLITTPSSSSWHSSHHSSHQPSRSGSPLNVNWIDEATLDSFRSRFPWFATPSTPENANIALGTQMWHTKCNRKVLITNNPYRVLE